MSLILTKFVCKAVVNNSIYVYLYPFCCIFRALWPATSLVTGAPMLIYPVHWAVQGACAHGEVTVALFHTSVTLK